MIILLVGPSRSGKTQFIRNLETLNLPFAKFDDALPVELLEQREAIRREVGRCGLVVIAVYSLANPAELDDLIKEWMGEFRVSVFRTIDILGA